MTDHPLCPLPHKRDPERPRRAAFGVRVCAGHLLGLAEDIAALPRLHATLAQHLVASGGGDGGRSSDADVGVDLNPAVVTARDHIRQTLVSWALIALEEGPWDTAPEDDVRHIAVWIGKRCDWYANQDWTDEFVSNIRETVRESRALIQPNSTYRIEIGPCPELLGDDQAHCEGVVIAVMQRASSREQLPSEIRCTAHGEDEDEPHAWSPIQWHALGRRMGKSMHASAADAFIRSVSG